ncbi:hypothetical protein T484DRAFT_1780726 [Baffinella frigidus]|nr:hypothetical protein T484DRAFT_1780726 [Cryptophyta sp. CCMP2293]
MNATLLKKVGGRSLTAMALLLATGANAFAPASMFTGSLRRASAVSSRPQLRAARLSMSAETDAGTARGVGDRDSGRHLDDTTEREKAVADLYGPFWEYAAGQLKELGVDLSSYPIPDG